MSNVKMEELLTQVFTFMDEHAKKLLAEYDSLRKLGMAAHNARTLAAARVSRSLEIRPGFMLEWLDKALSERRNKGDFDI